jgi:SAM-dependent methyltransferase
MHDTAFQIGSLAMNIYADLRTDSILEVGSQAVNGSLRENALPTTHYVGVDIEEGKGVDIVVEPSKPFPTESDSFDLVIASSVFEHDPFFWLTFLEMCRAARDGGYVYINAPSNGLVHRYPQDNWRFYPDAGRALAKWAVTQGIAITLVESFIAKREKDVWNDFVAVFRKGPITKTLPKVFLHEHVACTDVITWKSKKIVNPSEQTEDAILLTQAAERARVAEDELTRALIELESLEQEAVELKTRLAVAEDERQRNLAEAGDIRGELNLRQSELIQRQEEIEQSRSELLQAERRLEAEKQLNASILEQLRERELELVGKMAHSESLATKLSIAEADLKSAKDKLTDGERRVGELVRSLNEAQSAHSELERRLAAHFHETATLSRVILECQQATASESKKAHRILELYNAVVSQPRWWSILSRSHRSRRLKARLHRLGLFDGESYLRKNPDVGTAGEDPLHHYLHHGIDERRPT